MPLYMIQWKLSPEGLASTTWDYVEAKKAVSARAEKQGSKVLGYWVVSGDCDGMVLVDASDGHTALAGTIASIVGAGGAVAEVRTSRLFSPEEANAAYEVARELLEE